MTILEANKQLNELITNKIYLEQYQNYVSSWTLNGKYILCDGFPVCLLPLGYKTDDCPVNQLHNRRKNIEEIVEYK